MKRAAIFAILLCAGGMVTVTAQRIFTTPNPSAELKQLFPSAAAFSPLEGTPLHFTAYSADPKSNPAARPLGIACWTTDLVPQEHGYHGPIPILVGLAPSATITAVALTYTSAPSRYFSVL